MQVRRFTAAIILFALLTLVATTARAEGVRCWQQSTTFLTLPTIKVAADVPIGAEIWRKDNISFTATCAKWIDQGVNQAYLWTRELTIPNTGLAFNLTYKGQTATNTATQIATGIWIDGLSLWCCGGTSVPGTVDLVLRRTGTTPTSGNVSTTWQTVFEIAGNDRNDPWWFNLNGINNISFVQYTCQIDSASQNIKAPLGDIRIDKFTGIGSTSPEYKFPINLTCSQPAGTYTVSLTFNATADSSGTPGVLALTGGASAASGVGIQLLKDGAPVEFGKAIQIGTSTAANFAVSMSARYYQTAASIKPGQANGIATFVVTYK